jgi:dUTPase
VVDADYRGNVGVVLFNFSQTDYEGALPRDSLTPLVFDAV